MKWLVLFVGILCMSVARRHPRYHHHPVKVTIGPDTTTISSTSLSTDIQQVESNIGQKSDTIKVINAPGSSASYPKHHGRHVCTSELTVPQPVKTVETWCKPAFRTYTQPCQNNQLCQGVRLVYETAYRDVMKTQMTRSTTYKCCPGWVQVHKTSNNCNKPICPDGCKNGGYCVSPNHCKCTKGFRGKHCELDINECKEQKPCDQFCYNNEGSFRCECRENFILQPDGQSCKKEGGDGPALEAGELEFYNLSLRIAKLEKLMLTDKFHRDDTEILKDLRKTMNSLSSRVSQLKTRIDDVETSTKDIKTVRDRLSYLEHRTNNIAEKLAFHKRYYP